MKDFEPVTDLQWEQIKTILPTPVKRGRGQPHAPWRPILNSILFVLLFNAKWGAWPATEDFGTKSSAHRWYLIWSNNGLLKQILEIYQPDLEIALPQRRTYTIREANTFEEAQIPLYIEIEDTNAISETQMLS
ncbi:MAG TPA: transposase [Gammaproteobacteria bacterium]|nr:transposase [Gammaproteobacteria bacterium]